ncbi:hypothetical protein [Burkholderia ubonensis]|uniref:hypothetical protein n=1 Tax=Burkholderia ubonensis TaxID=101571 RepID=UPI000A555871|nr:hypothetical protein [Burkholderia ubonensis]
MRFGRRRQIERLTAESPDWIAPFISQLCGKYVIEILDDVEQRLPRVDRDAYGAFIRENPAFYRKTRDRMVSYWNYYYQWLYERKHDYVLISRNGSIPHMKISRRALLPATPSAFSVEM